MTRTVLTKTSPTSVTYRDDPSKEVNTTKISVVAPRFPLAWAARCDTDGQRAAKERLTDHDCDLIIGGPQCSPDPTAANYEPDHVTSLRSQKNSQFSGDYPGAIERKSLI